MEAVVEAVYVLSALDFVVPRKFPPATINHDKVSDSDVVWATPASVEAAEAAGRACYCGAENPLLYSD